MPRISAARSLASLVAVCLAACACREQPALAVDPPQTAQTTPRELVPGDQAPAFELPGSDGRVYRLADFKGHRPVVLAWFAKAFTDG